MKIHLTLILGICVSVFGYAQELPTVLPPSPTASSLGEYGNVPVSNYTGIPNISIPLYTVRSGEIEFPISLSYHASGIKVAQEAGWVGLGWALNAGGVITRSVMGLDDLMIGGYVTTREMSSTSSNLADFNDPSFNIPAQIAAYNDIKNGVKDGQPDMFYYNFLGQSGKMIFERNSGPDIKGIPFEQTHTKFSYNKANKEWTVTDGNGWKYFFGTIEQTQNHSPGNPTSQLNPLGGRDFYRITRMDTIGVLNPNHSISAWYIDRIITPKGDEVTFEYDERERGTIGQINYSEKEGFEFTNLYTSDRYDDFYSGAYDYTEYNLSANMQWTSDIYLNRINFKNGYIDFSTTDKEDMRQDYWAALGNDSKPQKLSTLEVSNLSDEPIKKVTFDYSYFNGNITSYNKENYWRLKLNSIQESFYNDSSGSYSTMPPYSFTYNPINLPAKNSASIDHWGYFNGHDNDHVAEYYKHDVSGNLQSGFPLVIQQEYTDRTEKYFMPFMVIKEPYADIVGQTPFARGAFRGVDANKMQASILQRVKYPTGGATKFTFEPNIFDALDDNDPDNPYEDELKEVIVQENSTTEGSVSDTFTLTDHSRLFIECALEHYNTGQTFENIVAKIEKSTGEGIISFKPTTVKDGLFNSKVQIFLPPGNYRIVVDNGSTDDNYLRLKVGYVIRKTVRNKVGGGVRVSKIESLDGSDRVVKTKIFGYEYNNGVSTGRAMSRIKHIYPENTYDVGGQSLISGSSISENWGGTNIIRSSENQMPMGSSAQGNYVGYNRVSVSDVDSVGNAIGKSVFNYTNDPDEESTYHLPGLPTITNQNNGHLKKEEHFDENNILLKSIETVPWEVKSSEVITKGVIVQRSLYTAPWQTSPNSYYYRFYSVFSEWWHPLSNIEITYDKNGLNPVTTVTDYEYNNAAHKNLSKTIITTSNNKVIVNTMEYPSDYPLGTATTGITFNRMVSDNMLNPIIKQETSLNGSIKIGKTVNNFIVDPHDHVVLSNIQTAKGNAVLEDRMIIHDHYPNGNIKEVSKKDGTHEFYAWGYNGEYPVIRVEDGEDNIVMSSIQNALPSGYNTLETLLASIPHLQNDPVQRARWLTYNNDLRTALPNSMVTTYTYDPLVGITSMTDPKGNTIYYVYDSFNRLKEVRDADGKLVTDYEYHYKND